MAISYQSNILPSFTEAARLLGGEARGNRILCPGPGHSRRDRSLSVCFDRSRPEGYTVTPFSPRDDWRTCRDYVRDRLGLAPWGPPQSPAEARRSFPARRARLPTTMAQDDSVARTGAATRIW